MSKNKMMCALYTIETLKTYHMDYFHSQKYGEPRCDKYDFKSVNDKSLLNLMETADHCARVISIGNNIINNAVSRDTYYISPVLQHIFKDCEDLKMVDLGIPKGLISGFRKFKLKSFMYDEDSFIVEYKERFDGKRSRHRICRVFKHEKPTDKILTTLQALHHGLVNNDYSRLIDALLNNFVVKGDSPVNHIISKLKETKCS